MRHGSELPGAREWDTWLIVLGAALAGGKARELVFAKLAPDDCPYACLRPILSALAAGDTQGARQRMSGLYFLHGLDTSNGTLQGIVDRVSETAAKRKRIEEAEQALKEALK